MYITFMADIFENIGIPPPFVNVNNKIKLILLYLEVFNLKSFFKKKKGYTYKVSFMNT